MAFYECGGGLPTQEKSITATTSQQIVLPDTGFAMSKVTVNPQNHSGSATPASRTSSYDLGQNHNVRYINTNSVPNSNSGTYPATSRSSSLDMGSTNSYRYVDTTGVPNSNSGTYSATSRGSSLDMGSTNSYRYVNTNSVPNNPSIWSVIWYNSSPSSNFSAKTVNYSGYYKWDQPLNQIAYHILRNNTSMFGSYVSYSNPLSRYYYIAITYLSYKTNSNSSTVHHDIFLRNGSSSGSLSDRNVGDTSGTIIIVDDNEAFRRYDIYSNKCEFENCYVISFDDASPSPSIDNACIIPLAISGTNDEGI